MNVANDYRAVGAITALLGVVLAAADPADTNYDESKVPAYDLPELLVTQSGQAVTSAVQWSEERRLEVLNLLADNVYGHTPERTIEIRPELIESDSQALGGKATRKQIRLHIDPQRKLSIDLLLYIPNHSQEPSPAFTGLNFYGNQTIHPDPSIKINDRWMRGNADIGIVKNRATEATRGVYQARWQVEMLIRHGYALATAYCGDIDPDNYQHDFSDGIHPLFYEDGQRRPHATEWGTIGAWAWGLSRMLDYLVREEPGIDSKRIGVIGHSRLGKTALWAGAQDERFAWVISNNSGCGGAALYRRCYGERIHHMIKPVGYWFCSRHAEFAMQENRLPVDQHMLLATIAPRPLYVASATNDQWADPKGEFLAAAAASQVYELFGKSGLPHKTMPAPNQPVHGHIGYHLREGNHAVTAYDWEQYLRFVDTHVGRR